jgi:ribosomal protein L40E
LGFCTKCGKDLLEDAFFCPRCGIKTIKGTEAGVATPYEDWRDALARAGKELDRISVEIGRAFEPARKKLQETFNPETKICSNCGEKNRGDAVYCNKCGKSLVKTGFKE